MPPGKNTYPGMTAVPKSTGRPINTNIAAVEPYHHVPSSSTNHYQPALDVKRNHRKSEPPISTVNVDQNQRSKLPHYSPHNQKEVKMSPSDEQRTTQFSSDDDRRQLHKYPSEPSDSSKPEDRIHEFWPNKFDSKYQTLPSGTKFSVANNINNANSKYILRKPGEGVEASSPSNHDVVNQKSNDRKYSEDNYNNNIKDSVEMTNDKNNNSGSSIDSGKSTNANANVIVVGNQPTSQMQQTNIVRSIPIPSNSNKGLATPLSNINYLSRSTTCSTAGNTSR